MLAYTKSVRIGEVQLTVFSLRHLAEKLHRSPNTIKFWIWKKVVPPPVLRTKDGRKWYLAEEVEAYVRLAEEEDIKNGNDFRRTDFTKRLFAEVELARKNLERHCALRKGMKP